MTANKTTKVWFPEPKVENDSFAGKDETWFQWVSRATSKKGQESRRFLNENISTVPSGWQSKLYNDFRTRDWHTVFFELIVARTLQILGGEIEVELPVRETNRRPDFYARFGDETITVEATVPELNRATGKQMEWNEELVEIIESFTPLGWTVLVWRLPKLGPNDSKREFKRAIARAFQTIPPNPSSDSTPLEIGGFDDELYFTLLPGRSGKRAAAARGMVAGADDTESRIRAAVTNKKKQVRKSEAPVVLAISASPFGGLDDFDQALYGLSFESVDHKGKTIRTGFRPTGLFGTPRAEAPTVAGVLAYRSVGFTEVIDPVLYLHPRFNGTLPEALKKLELRSLNASGIQGRPALAKNVLDELNFVVLR
ncbi:MAG TPA: hypothetical protein VN843_27640 [Anaerolineales bacterium]|nr:hypothetical protein [Anaerolineales bacterium]